jgi:hypothetical protein
MTDVVGPLAPPPVPPVPLPEELPEDADVEDPFVSLELLHAETRRRAEIAERTTKEVPRIAVIVSRITAAVRSACGGTSWGAARATARATRPIQCPWRTGREARQIGPRCL